ncbi:MAG: tetratricopeptide repeat protein [Spirochaetes bacterium]|nr:tetratricopeptide repeat protein [Spirochaetota bacterium]MBU1081179.1 tetratricopeptide repeat protein [Spirochaetota bacterium]
MTVLRASGGASARYRRLAACLAAALSLSAGACASQQAMRQAVGWTELGNAWAELGRWDKAGDAWSRAMALDPGQGVAGYNLSRALAEAGKYDESIAKSDEYLETDPDNAAVLSVKAYALHMSERDDEALAVYERVVALNGSDVASVYNLAVLLEAAGRGGEALERYEAVLALKPEDPNAAFRKGLILASEGDAEAAIPLLERFVAANPDAAPAARALALAQERAGLYAKAMETYASLVGKDEADSQSWFALARLRLTVAEDGPGGLEALKSALLNGFADGELAAGLLDAPGLVSPGAVRAALEEAGILAEKAPPATSDQPTGDAPPTPTP